MLKAKGKFQVTPNSIKIVFDVDFCRYYRWLFDRAHYYTIKTQLPKHGGHVNVVSNKIHAGTDCTKYMHLDGQEIEFEYDVEGNYGGFTKGFLNFWLDVECPTCVNIATDLGVLKPKEGFAFFHASILNTKNK